MFTLLFIIIIIVGIMSLKKKKHNSLQDMENRNNFPDFVVVATPMSTFSKILNLAVDKRELLKSISYKKGLVTIKMENGKDFIGMLSDLHVDFAKNQGLISGSSDISSDTTVVECIKS